MSAVFVGPTLKHYHKTFHTYLFFAATLTGLQRELQDGRTFGTDGEIALADALLLGPPGFPMFDTISKTTSMLVTFLKSVQNILDDVLRSLTSKVFTGLNDCHSEDEVKLRLRALESW